MDIKVKEEYLQKAFFFAKQFDKEPSYHVRDLKFYLGELEDGTIYESTGTTALSAVEQLIEDSECKEELQIIWKKIKGEEIDETVE